MKQRLPTILLIAALLAAAGAGVWYFFLRARPPEFTYRTVKAERGRVIARVTSTGTLSANVTVLVGSQVSGRLQQINVDFNSQVKKGELLAKIDPQLFEAALAQARASYYAAQGNVTKAKAQALDADRQYARQKALRAEGIVAQTDVDAAETNAAVAKASIDAAKGAMEQARANVEQAQVNLAYTKIFSPIDGVVISRSVDVGQTVAASLSAPTLFTIAQDLSKMQVDTNIAEGDVGKLRPDMPTTFLVDAYPNERFRGKIRQIRNAPQTVQNVVTYDAVIDVDNTDLKLKPGMTANVTIIYAEKDDVLVVPNTALRFRPPPAIAGSASAGPARRGGPGGSGGPGGPGGSGGPGSGRSGGGRRRGQDSGAPSASPSGSAGAPPASASAIASAAPPAPSGSGAPPETGSAAMRGPRSDTMQERKTLWVLRGLKPEPISVQAGLSDGTVTEILDGDLHEGDEVVLEATSSDDAPPKSTSNAQNPRFRM